MTSRFLSHPTPLPPPPRYSTAVGVLSIAVAAAFAGYLTLVSRGPLPVDVWWHSVVAVEKGGAAYAIAVFLAEVGSGVGAAACTAIGAALFIARRRWRDAWAVCTAMAIGIAGSEGLKRIVLRPRPWDQLYTFSGSSYPSGHSMGAAALAVSLALTVLTSRSLAKQMQRSVALIATVWVIAMMWSRTALHVHWFSDVLGGALIGLGAALLARAFWFRQQNDPQRSSSVSRSAYS